MAYRSAIIYYALCSVKLLLDFIWLDTTGFKFDKYDCIVIHDRKIGASRYTVPAVKKISFLLESIYFYEEAIRGQSFQFDFISVQWVVFFQNRHALSRDFRDG